SDCKHKIIFQHIPLFVDRPDEAAHVYFNIEPGERLRLMNKFIEAGVSTVFCGHYHQNAGGFYQQLECVVTSAVGAQLGSDGHGYRLVRVSEEKVEHNKNVMVNFQDNLLLSPLRPDEHLSGKIVAIGAAIHKSISYDQLGAR
ncbi:calcineurin-like phosphoesterase domain-containing, partial [Brachionus plicatilis]